MLDAELAETVDNLRVLGTDIADVEVKNSHGGLRPDSAPGTARWRFRSLETKCGQGQDRTVDLPLFRRTLIPTELPDLGAM